VQKSNQSVKESNKQATNKKNSRQKIKRKGSETTFEGVKNRTKCGPGRKTIPPQQIVNKPSKATKAKKKRAKRKVDKKSREMKSVMQRGKT